LVILDYCDAPTMLQQLAIGSLSMFHDDELWWFMICRCHVYIQCIYRVGQKNS